VCDGLTLDLMGWAPVYRGVPLMGVDRQKGTQELKTD
jgi:hypothetical protein